MTTVWIRWAITAVAVLAVGCRTMVVKTNHPDAAIYVDEELVGYGEAKVRAMGTPKSSVVKVVHNGQSVERKIKRTFTVKTAVAGLFTYGTGFFWGWEYPEAMTIRLELHPENQGWATGLTTGSNPWTTPMYQTSDDGASDTPNGSAADPWSSPLNAGVPEST